MADVTGHARCSSSILGTLLSLNPLKTLFGRHVVDSCNAWIV